MFVVVGTYVIKPKRVAFRNDYCLRCGGQRLAVQVRAFYLAYLYWIPVLPLGFWKRWLCSDCAHDPHQAVHTRPVFKGILVAVLVALGLPFWFGHPGPGEEPTYWVLRVVTAVGLAGTIWWLKTGTRPASLRDCLASVPAYSSRHCPFCGGFLYDQPNLHCPACGLRCEAVRGGCAPHAAEAGASGH